MLRRALIVTSALALVLIIALGAALLLRPDLLRDSGSSGTALIGGPFKLTDQNGRRVSDGDLRGRLLLVDFGYTHCPDICPIGLATIDQAMATLSPERAAKVQPLFITLDPSRDTSAVLKDYLSAFEADILGLTGTEEEVAAATRAYRVYAQKVPAADGGADYTMDHSTFIYLMDTQGRYVTHFRHDNDPDAMAARIAEAVDKATG